MFVIKSKSMVFFPPPVLFTFGGLLSLGLRPLWAFCLVPPRSRQMYASLIFNGLGTLSKQTYIYIWAPCLYLTVHVVGLVHGDLWRNDTEYLMVGWEIQVNTGLCILPYTQSNGPTGHKSNRTATTGCNCMIVPYACALHCTVVPTK